MVISFFTARITLQVLGVEDYGLNNLVGSVVALFSFINSSMSTAVLRFFNISIGRGDNKRMGKIYGVGVYLHIIIAIITIVMAELFALFFLGKMNIPQERMFAAQVVFQISIFSMALTIVNIPNYALLKAREMFSKTAMIEIVEALLRLLILYMLYTIDYDKLIVYSSLNLGVTLFYVSSLFYMARQFPESHHHPCKEPQLIKEMLKFVSFLLITVLAELGRNQGVVMLINLFFGLAINAAYAVAVQISNMVSTFVINIKQPIIPQMMAAYGAGDRNSMFKLIDFGTKVTALMMMMLTIPVMFEVDYLLALWLKTPPQYTSGLVILVLININISSFTYFLYQGVHATGNITKQQICMSALYVINILAIYLAFKIGCNFYTALYITIVISTFQCILNMLMAKKYYAYKILRFVLRILLPCLITAGIISLFLYSICCIVKPSFVRVMIVGMLGITSCLFLGYQLVLNESERQKVVSFIVKRNRRIT